ncbi:MAG: xanthine dehydrogenase family protein subunit M [Hyphomicrobiales bacterium]|nr:MAG: xanthine dehydrogenase family protein subunit M [Hyphomicrobiales bacterium]
MKSPQFAYHRPQSVADATALLARLENAKVLAGGQSLMPMLNMRYALPDHVVDINRIPELSGITIEGDRITIGAMTRQRDIERSDALFARAPIFREALRHVGHIQTRSRGTIGGSLCHLDPAAELPGLVRLFDGTVHVIGPGGERSIAATDWGLGYMTPAIGADEIATAITFNVWSGRRGEAFEEFARRHGDFAIAGAGVRLQLDTGGHIARVAMVLVGVDVAPVRLLEAETALVGRAPDAAAIAVAKSGLDPLDVLSDAQNSAAYRKHIAGVMLARAFRRAAQSAGAHHA